MLGSYNMNLATYTLTWKEFYFDEFHKIIVERVRIF